MTPEEERLIRHRAEDGREWPFNGLDEMQRWLRLRADQTEKGEV